MGRVVDMNSKMSERVKQLAEKAAKDQFKKKPPKDVKRPSRRPSKRYTPQLGLGTGTVEEKRARYQKHIAKLTERRESHLASKQGVKKVAKKTSGRPVSSSPYISPLPASKKPSLVQKPSKKVKKKTPSKAVRNSRVGLNKPGPNSKAKPAMKAVTKKPSPKPVVRRPAAPLKKPRAPVVRAGATRSARADRYGNAAKE